MNTPIIHKIADTPPEFRADTDTWLWAKAYSRWHMCPGAHTWEQHYWQATHWCHSDTCPTVTPETEPIFPEGHKDYIENAENMDDERRFSAVAEQLESDSFSVADDAPPQLPVEVREAIDWMEHAPDTRNVTEDWKSTHQKHIAVLRDYFANKANTATDIQTFAPSPQSTTGETVSHADTVEISHNDRENKVNTELNAIAEHLFGPENFDGVGLAQPNADVEKVAEEIALTVFGEADIKHHREVAAILRQRDAERDAEMWESYAKALARHRKVWEIECGVFRAEIERLSAPRSVMCSQADVNEIAALKAQNDVHEQHITALNERAIYAEDQLAALEQQLKEAKKDSERLDWLCRPWESQMRGKQTVSYTMENIDGSFRSAIDAARSTS